MLACVEPLVVSLLHCHFLHVSVQCLCIPHVLPPICVFASSMTCLSSMGPVTLCGPCESRWSIDASPSTFSDSNTVTDWPLRHSCILSVPPLPPRPSERRTSAFRFLLISSPRFISNQHPNQSIFFFFRSGHHLLLHIPFSHLLALSSELD